MKMSIVLPKTYQFLSYCTFLKNCFTNIVTIILSSLLSNQLRKNPYKVLVGIPEGKRSLGRPRCKGKDTIKIDLRVIR
jgi:hypothetical protein